MGNIKSNHQQGSVVGKTSTSSRAMISERESYPLFLPSCQRELEQRPLLVKHGIQKCDHVIPQVKSDESSTDNPKECNREVKGEETQNKMESKAGEFSFSTSEDALTMLEGEGRSGSLQETGLADGFTSVIEPKDSGSLLTVEASNNKAIEFSYDQQHREPVLDFLPASSLLECEFSDILKLNEMESLEPETDSELQNNEDKGKSPLAADSINCPVLKQNEQEILTGNQLSHLLNESCVAKLDASIQDARQRYEEWFGPCSNSAFSHLVDDSRERKGMSHEELEKLLFGKNNQRKSNFEQKRKSVSTPRRPSTAKPRISDNAISSKTKASSQQKSNKISKRNSISSLQPVPPRESKGSRPQSARGQRRWNVPLAEF